MGGAFSCCTSEEEEKRPLNRPVPANVPEAAVSPQAQTQPSRKYEEVSGVERQEDNDAAQSMMHAAVGEHYGEDAFDKLRCKVVFDILEVEQKFTSKMLYEKKYIWVNLAGRSIHMSEHPSKERRHKEASLTDVTEVVCGIPKKFKEGLVPVPEHCLTIVFKRGGGLDLKFDSENTRDIWAETLNKIVKQVRDA